LKIDISPYLHNLNQPSSDSHKGQNGKLLVIGGSHLFHAASLWSLKIASRICDMVFYSSVPENNQIVEKCKEEFRDGIIVPRNDLEHYIKEADCILIGPGMMRQEKIRVNPLEIRVDPNQEHQSDENKLTEQQLTLKEINNLKDEGQQTYYLTKYILENHKDKKFVLDAGALQELELAWLEGLKERPILTPHTRELEMLAKNNNISTNDLIRRDKPPGLSALILLKGQIDTIYSPNREPIEIEGGVPGMTKGGTGDVLAGLLAALYAKNDYLTSTITASFFNKKAGEELSKTMGNNFNSSDLIDQLPKTIHKYLS
jgi:NAD(P)H-hydrate repair Nnr-like enzyme with NAD(P)H-hydrate dehydratase domain